MSNFSTKTRSLLNEDGTKMKLTEEQKDALLTVQNAGNAAIYEGMATSVSSVEIAKAVEAATTGTTQSNADVFASSIDLATPEGHEIISCATSKATNVVTGDLKDAVVWKLTQNLRVHQSEGATTNAAIRSDSIMPFVQKTTAVTEDIVKKATIRDFSMSGTVFPQDINLSDELNAYIAFMGKYKYSMLAEFMVNAAKAELSENQRLTIYRAASRSLEEEMFDKVWSEHFPLYDTSNGEDVRNYIDAKRAYLASLETIGNKYVSDSSINFGMSIRKLSISPSLKWSSEAKVGHVKKFGADKSYYVGSNIDAGIQTIPTTTAILGNKIKDIVTLTKVGCALIEKEVRLENGLTGKIDIPKYDHIKFNEELLGKPYYELLNTTKQAQDAIYERLIEKLVEKAETVVAAVETKINSDNSDALRALLGK